MRKTKRDDPELIRAANGGDMGAFEELVRAHNDAVYAHAYRFFGDVQSAQDATQEVWVNVYRALPEFEGRSSVSTWLFRITRNACLDMLRAGRRVATPIDPVDIHRMSRSDTAGDAGSKVDLQLAMRALSPEDRDAFNAVALFGLPYAEAGAAMGVPAGTVKSRVFRARRALVALLALDASGGEAS
ncbi:MAG TPA: RNA polymerase sigma factor [Coriobacteriia bacterium]